LAWGESTCWTVEFTLRHLSGSIMAGGRLSTPQQFDQSHPLGRGHVIEPDLRGTARKLKGREEAMIDLRANVLLKGGLGLPSLDEQDPPFLTVFLANHARQTASASLGGSPYRTQQLQCLNTLPGSWKKTKRRNDHTHSFA
jgi:hypothetical protein